MYLYVCMSLWVYAYMCAGALRVLKKVSTSFCWSYRHYELPDMGESAGIQVILTIKQQALLTALPSLQQLVHTHFNIM